MSFRKQRFYLYSRRLPSDLQDIDRDVFNEKPSKEDIIAVPEGQGLFDSCIGTVFDLSKKKYFFVIAPIHQRRRYNDLCYL